MSLSETKHQLRRKARLARASFAAQRGGCGRLLWQKLSPLLPIDGRVLSFCSIGSEIDTAYTNRELAAQGKLALPRVVGEELSLYEVEDCEHSLRTSALGISEPDSCICSPLSPEEIALVLVPGLLFDANRHRLGYGKGMYDRLLCQIDSSRTLGIGYCEQFSETLLPIEAHDIPLGALLLC